MSDIAGSGGSPAGVGLAIRTADRQALARALAHSRADTLGTFAAYVRALGAPQVAVPYRAELNPPLWELGHIGWFQEWWIARNPQRALGVAADPDAARPDSVRPGGDALYNSSRVAHATRWQLPLPGIGATRSDLARQLEQTLALLDAERDDEDATLYFYRLALLHEDMHHEAAVYMAQTLAIDLDDPRWRPAPMPAARSELRFDAATHDLGGATGARGFRFDNECEAHEAPVDAFAIDTRTVNWAEWIAFTEAGGYTDARLWSEPGWAWRQAQPRQCAAPLRRGSDGWQRRSGSRWLTMQGPALLEAACHLTHHEAEAWCRWAARRLPTEAEWERAALARPETFRWGDVWEWTASSFAPYPGFKPHPYRDYSQPWFDGRPVLKGASWATQPRMRHPRYRNYFQAHRDDVPAGLRSCAL